MEYAYKYKSVISWLSITSNTVGEDVYGFDKEGNAILIIPAFV